MSWGWCVLGALAPDRRSLLRLPGHPSVALLTYAAALRDPGLDLRRDQRGAPTHRGSRRTRTSSSTTGRASPSPRSRSRGPGSRRRSGERAGGFASAATAIAAVGVRDRRADLRRYAGAPSERLVVARGRRRHRVLAPRPGRGGAGGPVHVTSRARSPFRRFERWLVGCLHGRPRLRPGAARDATDQEEGAGARGAVGRGRDRGGGVGRASLVGLPPHRRGVRVPDGPRCLGVRRPPAPEGARPGAGLPAARDVVVIDRVHVELDRAPPDRRRRRRIHRPLLGAGVDLGGDRPPPRDHRRDVRRGDHRG